MATRFKVKLVVARSGERMPLVVDTATCLPHPGATIYATSLVRPASGSHSKLEQELRGVAGLLAFLDVRGIDLPARVASGAYSDDAARVFQPSSAHRSNLMPPTIPI